MRKERESATARGFEERFAGAVTLALSGGGGDPVSVELEEIVGRCH
jgi:hypothetical protein